MKMDLINQIELNSDLIEKLNDLIGLDRTQLSNKESSNEIISKLKNKKNILKDNFIANMPYKYTNDENEFIKFCNKIQNLRDKLDLVKRDDLKLKNTIDEYKQDLEINNQNEHETINYETELKPLILKSISIKRQIYYFKSLIKLEEFKSKIESYLSQYTNLKQVYDNQQQQQHQKQQQQLQQDNTNNLNNKKLSIELNNLIEKLVELYLDLIDYASCLCKTKCDNFKSYLNQLVNYLYEKIKLIFISEFETNLKNVSYPLNTSNVTSPTQSLLESNNNNNNQDTQNIVSNNNNNNKENLEYLLKVSAKRLLVIQNPSTFLNNDNLNKQIDNDRNIIIDLLVKPFEKRFKFHFFTNRKTNNLDKPEWYLSQIIQWIKDQHEFINRVIQPVFMEIDYLRDESAIILFSNGLVCLIKEKLEFDLNNLLKNQIQFSHTIDELILFSSQLAIYLTSEENFKSTIYSSLHVICENSILFSHWINLEKQVCQKKLDLIFSSLLLNQQQNSNQINETSSSLSIFNNDKLINEIWSCNYADVDSMKPPQCAESFILMIKAMTDRYSSLPYASKKLRFVHLQLELINDYHLRLCQIIRDEVKTPFSKSYLGVLNTCNYIIYILDEWKNSTFFIEMQFYKLKYIQFLKKIDQSFSSNDFLQTNFHDDLCKVFDQQMSIYDCNNKSKLNSLFEMEGTLFDEILPSYEKVKDDMIHTITSNCKWELTSRSKLYKREKWMSMPLFSEYYKPTLTQSAADMLISLRNMLHMLKDSIAKSLFESILKKITLELDKFFYQDLILNSQFNEGGILQLDFDLNKYLMPILKEFENDINIENYFKATRECLILLKLKQGSAILLKDVLNKAQLIDDNYLINDANSNRKLCAYNAKNALKEIGVVYLNCDQAKDILNLRTDFIDLN